MVASAGASAQHPTSTMPSSTAPTAVDRLQALPASAPKLYTVSDIVKLVEAAKKHEGPQDVPLDHVPEYTNPNGPNSYRCTKSMCFVG